MKRYLIVLLFVLAIVGCVQNYPAPLFKLNFPQIITYNLFNNLRDNPGFGDSIIVLGSFILTGQEIKEKIDTLLTIHPKKIAINLCDIRRGASDLIQAYADNPVVVLGECGGEKDLFGRLIDDHNVVTHFKTDNPNYLELRAANTGSTLKDRGNALERINYYGSFDAFLTLDLDDMYALADLEVFRNKTILIGYCGMGPPDAVNNYRNAHITPLNSAYDQEERAPDMFDIHIAANIVRTINERSFIYEVNLITRIAFMLLCAFLLVLLITVIQTRWLLLNLVIYLVFYLLFIVAGTLLIVLLFSKNIYLDIPEYAIVLFLVAVFTVFYNQFYTTNEPRTPQE